MTKDIFDEKNFGADSEVTSQTMQWGKIGDFILGTFVKARHNVETQFGENSIYEFLAEKGKYHLLVNKVPVDQESAINKGETWAVWGRNDIFNGILNSLVPGQIVKIAYVEDKSTKMGQSKIIKIYAPKTNTGGRLMNDEWLDTQGITGADM